MLKRIFIGTMAFSFLALASNTVFAQQQYMPQQEQMRTTQAGPVIEHTVNVFSPELADPLALQVKTGDQLNLKVKNHSRDDIVFKVPIMDIAVLVPKANEVVIPISFDQPIEENIRFVVEQEGSNFKSGDFLVTDYREPALITSRSLDTSELQSLMTYQTYQEERKQEPTYSATQQQPEPRVEEQTGRFVRGYW
jgi:hypothetical protein